jgi:hypothetical protein
MQQSDWNDYTGGPPVEGIMVAPALVPELRPVPAPDHVVFDRFSPPIPLETAKRTLHGVVGVYAVLDLLPDRELLIDVGLTDDDLAKRLSDPERTFCWAGNAQGTVAISYCAIPGMTLEPWVERRRVERYIRRTFRPTCCDE